MANELVFGKTRTSLGPRHVLIALDGHVTSTVPGIENATTIILISPAMGAGFTQFLVTFNQAGVRLFSR
jgi:(S)-ureidoglycine aminohydrolase